MKVCLSLHIDIPGKKTSRVHQVLPPRPVQFSADVDNHYDMMQRSLFIAPLVVIYCRELALHHRPQGATWNKGLHHLK